MNKEQKKEKSGFFSRLPGQNMDLLVEDVCPHCGQSCEMVGSYVSKRRLSTMHECPSCTAFFVIECHRGTFPEDDRYGLHSYLPTNNPYKQEMNHAHH